MECRRACPGSIRFGLALWALRSGIPSAASHLKSARRNPESSDGRWPQRSTELAVGLQPEAERRALATAPFKRKDPHRRFDAEANWPKAIAPRSPSTSSPHASIAGGRSCSGGLVAVVFVVAPMESPRTPGGWPPESFRQTSLPLGRSVAPNRRLSVLEHGDRRVCGAVLLRQRAQLDCTRRTKSVSKLRRNGTTRQRNQKEAIKLCRSTCVDCYSLRFR